MKSGSPAVLEHGILESFPEISKLQRKHYMRVKGENGVEISFPKMVAARHVAGMAAVFCPLFRIWPVSAPFFVAASFFKL